VPPSFVSKNGKKGTWGMEEEGGWNGSSAHGGPSKHVFEKENGEEGTVTSKRGEGRSTGVKKKFYDGMTGRKGH